MNLNYNKEIAGQGNAKEFITVPGYDMLQKKREKLVNEDLPKIAEALAAAREHHDYRENGELQAARAEKDYLDYELGKLVKYLNDVVPRSAMNENVVDFSLKVKVASTSDSSDVHEYILVGSGEFSLEKGSISYKAPFVQSMMGKAVGETFNFKNNAGSNKIYEILSITKPTEAELREAIC